MRILLLFSVLACLLISCKKDSPQKVDQSPRLSISSVNPVSGHPGDEITISGTGFNAAINSSTVKFNNVVATVSSVGVTSLKAKVPIGAGDGPVTITTSTGTATGPTFTYIPDVIAAGTIQSPTQVVALY